MKTDARTPEELIAFADLLVGGLDSLDLGDAMGAFIRILEESIQDDGMPADDLMLAGPGFTVTISAHWELFEWGGELPEGPFDHLTPGDIDPS